MRRFRHRPLYAGESGLGSDAYLLIAALAILLALRLLAVSEEEANEAEQAALKVMTPAQLKMREEAAKRARETPTLTTDWEASGSSGGSAK